MDNYIDQSEVLTTILSITLPKLNCIATFFIPIGEPVLTKKKYENFEKSKFEISDEYFPKILIKKLGNYGF